MFCTKCGKPYESGAKFCIDCGSKLQQQEWVDKEAECQGDSFRFDAMPKRRNGPGLVSFILALADIVIWLAAISVSAVLSMQGLGDDDPLMMLVGLIILVAFGATITGIILGIVGLTLKNRKRGLAVTGLVINSLLLVFVVFLIIVGVSMG